MGYKFRCEDDSGYVFSTAEFERKPTSNEISNLIPYVDIKLCKGSMKDLMNATGEWVSFPVEDDDCDPLMLDDAIYASLTYIG